MSSEVFQGRFQFFSFLTKSVHCYLGYALKHTHVLALISLWGPSIVILNISNATSAPEPQSPKGSLNLNHVSLWGHSLHFYMSSIFLSWWGDKTKSPQSDMHAHLHTHWRSATKREPLVPPIGCILNSFECSFAGRWVKPQGWLHITWRWDVLNICLFGNNKLKICSQKWQVCWPLLDTQSSEEVRNHYFSFFLACVHGLSYHRDIRTKNSMTTNTSPTRAPLRFWLWAAGTKKHLKWT